MALCPDLRSPGVEQAVEPLGALELREHGGELLGGFVIGVERLQRDPAPKPDRSPHPVVVGELCRKGVQLDDLACRPATLGDGGRRQDVRQGPTWLAGERQ